MTDRDNGPGMIDKYKEAFQEEARELLSELESALLELDRKHDDVEVLSRAFRALHTIKGSGAMFGFDDIAAFVHNLENAFDLLRTGKLAVTAPLINLTLAASDQIKTMLDAAAGSGVVDPLRSQEILTELHQLTGMGEARNVLGSLSPHPSRKASSANTVHAQAHDWRIHFRPGPDTLLNGTNPILLLRELQDLGTLKIRVDCSAIPPLGEIDAEKCYLAWDLLLTGETNAESIRDVFVFVEGDCELFIEQVPEVEAEIQARGVSRARAEGANRPGALVAAGASSIRVSADRLDQLVNLVGELVTVQARLGEIAGRREDADILQISESIDRLTAALRENSMSIRMLPLRGTFDRFRRLVHDLGRELHKKVELTTEGADTELDKTVIDQLNEPLVHLIRNSMDHAIESPEARRAAGKSEVGTIHLSARHSGAHVLIRVSDDGRGLDAEKVRARAVERGLVPSGARLSEAEIFSLILEPGFSTAREVTEVSGRGVGMDVVRRSVDVLRGTLDIASQPGAGLTVTLRLPLTLAIIDVLLVRVGDAHFVLPLVNSLECVELTPKDALEANGKHVAIVRGELIPYIRLSEYFQMNTPRPEREQIMVVETELGRYGFVVDRVLGDHQTVIKNLGRLYRNVQVVSGATILGNGTVALILDPHRVVQSVLQNGVSHRRAGNPYPQQQQQTQELIPKGA